MKLVNLFAVGVAAYVSVAAQTGVINGQVAPLTNILAVYLVADRDAAFNGQADLNSFKLEPTPVLSDGDFVAYNTNNHCFVVTARAAKKLNLRVKKEGQRGDKYVFDWPDTPFVIEASGERIYVGIFSSDFSSAAYFKEPVLKSSVLFIGENDTNDVTFCINAARDVYDFRREMDRAISKIKTEQFRGINADSVKRKAETVPHWAPDIRNDPRIIAAVRKLFSDQKH